MMERIDYGHLVSSLAHQAKREREKEKEKEERERKRERERLTVRTIRHS